MGVARSRILARYLGFHFSQPFRFADFLEMLIGEPVADRLQSNLNRGRKGPYSKPYFYISDGFMNFNHFTFRRNLFLGTPKNSTHTFDNHTQRLVLPSFPLFGGEQGVTLASLHTLSVSACFCKCISSF
jgi:hypothetical protein